MHITNVLWLRSVLGVTRKKCERQRKTPPTPPLNRIRSTIELNVVCDRFDILFVKVLTEAWQSTRVRVSIEDCTPRTAVIAAFGAEPTPSQHELLAHAMLDLSGNGTCGVDVISRPSYARDGVWCVLSIYKPTTQQQCYS